jgi:hypothetical protein
MTAGEEGTDMGAGSRFDQPLTLLDDGRKVVACGPLRFFGCDVKATVTLDLKQQQHGRASVSGEFVNTNFDPDRCTEEVGDLEDEWMLTAPVTPFAVSSSLRSSGWQSVAFVTAPAPGPLVKAHGVIVYTKLDGSQEIVRWKGDEHQNDLEVRWQ